MGLDMKNQMAGMSAFAAAVAAAIVLFAGANAEAGSPFSLQKSPARKIARLGSTDEALSRFKELMACQSRAKPSGAQVFEEQLGADYLACTRGFFSSKVSEGVERHYAAWLLVSAQSFQGPEACVAPGAGDADAPEKEQMPEGVEEVLCFVFTDAGRTAPGKIYFARESGLLVVTAIKY
jgi:hypothetical protein